MCATRNSLVIPTKAIGTGPEGRRSLDMFPNISNVYAQKHSGHRPAIVCFYKVTSNTLGIFTGEDIVTAPKPSPAGESLRARHNEILEGNNNEKAN